MNKASEALDALYDLMDGYFDNVQLKRKYDITEETAREKRRLIESALKELEQLKGLEEEYDLDLVTVHKALKNGIYDKETGERHFPELLWNTGINDWTLFCDGIDPYWSVCYRLREYGKTWVLTKEELE